MKNALIKWLGGFTEDEFDTSADKERDTQYRYYLNLRREELCRDRQNAVKHKRTVVDIDRRLKMITCELVDIENKEDAAMSPELRKFLHAKAQL